MKFVFCGNFAAISFSKTAIFALFLRKYYGGFGLFWVQKYPLITW